jgi:hypothetical protein
MLSINLTDEQVSKMVYRSHTSPYRLTTTSERLDPQFGLPVTENTTTSSGKIRHRRGVISIDSSEISLELGDIEVDGKQVAFINFNDTLTLNSWGEVFLTESFEIKEGSTLHWRTDFRVKDRINLKKVLGKKAGITLILDIRDAENHQVLESIEIKKIKQIIPRDTSNQQTTKLKAKKPGRVYLKARIETTAGVMCGESVVNCRYENEIIQLFKSSTPDIKTTEPMPSKFALYQNYPNPFNPSTTITFDLPRESKVTLRVYNTLGEEITTLISERRPAGKYECVWNSKSIASGIYIYRLEANNFVETRKMILLR